MRMRPRVSVIIPTFNRWDLVGDAIESALAQTFTDLEVVLVNDGGGEPAGKAVDLIRDDRVLYVPHAANRGLAAARNTGLSRCSGEYIAYLDDDDLYYPDHLETILSAMARNGWDVAYTDAFRATCEVVPEGVRVLKKEIVYSREFNEKELWKDNFIPVLCVVHRRECLEKAGVFDPDLPVLEDWDLWLRMSRHYCFHHIPQTTSEYRIRRDGSNMTEKRNRHIGYPVRETIYRKYLRDPTFRGDPVRLESLRGGIVSLLIDYRRWYLRKLTGDADGLFFRIVYPTLSGGEKLYLCALHPVVVAAHWLRRGISG